MIELVNLTPDKKTLKKIEEKIHQVLLSNSYILGLKVTQFEKKFAKLVKSGYAVGVGTGTDALRLSLRVLGINKGDKVLTTAFTSPFTVIAIVEEGAIPVFIDIDENTWTIDSTGLSAHIDKQTRAIIPVHIYGNPCAMSQIMRIAKKHKLKVIEDACQAHGASISGKMIGTFGDLSAFSFYPTKNLGAIGDGGIITTNHKLLARKLTFLRNGGQSERFLHTFHGLNSRLDELQAALLSVKIMTLKQNNLKRQHLAKRYKEGLNNLPITFQQVLPGGKHVYHQFVIRTAKRTLLKKFLLKQGIHTDIHYPLTVDQQPIFKVFASEVLPTTKKISAEILSLPCYPDLSVKNQDYIIKKIRRFFS